MKRPIVKLAPGVYGVNELALFDTVADRAEAATQVKPGTFVESHDPTRLLKTWVDEDAWKDAPTAVRNYAILINGEVHTIELSAAEAGTFNLPGLRVYPAYQISTETATRNGVAVDQRRLVSKEDAEALMKLTGGRNLQDQGRPDGYMPTVYGKDSKHRIWMFQRGVSNRIVYPGEVLYATALKGGGVGHPGHYEYLADHPEFVPDPDPPQGDWSRPQVGVPVRPLDPEREKLIPPGLVGSGFALSVAEPGTGHVEPPAGGFDPVLGGYIARTMELTEENNKLLRQLLSMPPR